MQRLTERGVLLARAVDSLRTATPHGPIPVGASLQAVEAELHLLEPTAQRILIATVDSADQYRVDLIVQRPLPKERLLAYSRWLQQRLSADTVYTTVSVVR